MKWPTFVGPSYVSLSVNAAAQRCMNLYPERIEVPGERAAYVLYSTPGIRQLLTLDQGPIRALFSQDDRSFGVGGNFFYELTRNPSTGIWSSTIRGVVAASTIPATITSGGEVCGQAVVTSGGYLYCYDLSTHAFTEEFNADITHSGFINGLFLGLDATNAVLKFSAQSDGTTWPADVIESRTRGSDRWVSLLVAHGLAWLFGSRTTEVWYDTGGATIPMAPIDGAFIQHGTCAAYSPAVVDNGVCWLSQSVNGGRMVLRALGFAPQRISTHALETALASYTTVSDAVGWSYQHRGHEFYVLSFPTEGHTWVFDASTGFWHERGYWGAGSMDYAALRQQSHCYANGVHLVGDRLTGDLYEQTDDVTTDADGATLRALRRAPHVSADRAWLFHDRLRLDMEGGVGTGSGQGANPQAMLRYSDDGGHTWSAERWEAIGRQGEYSTEVEWLRLGRSKDRVYEVVITDPVPRRIVSASLDLSRGVF